MDSTYTQTAQEFQRLANERTHEHEQIAASAHDIEAHEPGVKVAEE